MTGHARYTADHALPGQLHAACLGSGVAHARIVRIDTTAAEQVPGVRAVLTAADIGDVRYGRQLRDMPVLASDRVRFMGQRVAAVAADTRQAAEEAVRLIDVEYEELPTLLDPRLATTPDAPVLHPEAEAYRLVQGARHAPAHPNIQGELVVGAGAEELAAAFGRADHVFEHTFRTPRQHQGYIEPHAAIVWFDDDVCHVISTNKAPFGLRQQMAAATGHPVDKIVVYNKFIGGDFGGKGFSLDEYVCFYLARETGRPVRSIMSYLEDLSSTAPRHATELTLRTGVTRDGTFVAHSAEVLFDGGAYGAAKANAHLVPHGGVDTMSAYSVPATHHRLTAVYTNAAPGGHMRAPGDVQAIFAGESHVDMIASELGIDPVELRRKNLAGGKTEGQDPSETAAVIDQVLLRAADGIDWSGVRSPGRGVGVALYRRKGGTGRGGVVMRALSPDRIQVITGAADQGGGTVTMIARVAAATMGIPERQVEVVQQPTAEALFDSGAGASRVTRVLGEATRLAATELSRLIAEPGAVFPVEVAQEVVAPADEDCGAYGALAVEVEVDEETGQIRVVEAVLAADTGTVISPLAHRGQLEGGFVYGLGGALMEELPVEGGQIMCGTLGDYKLPTSPDVPPLRIVSVAGESGTGPYGAKAVGEFGNLGVAPAIANAVARASGVRLQQLPLSAEAVHARLRQTGPESAPPREPGG
nr:xanthine dehydrogenase family protein molybdopterin-binding subunit [Blastococcus saxobsidens]